MFLFPYLSDELVIFFHFYSMANLTYPLISWTYTETNAVFYTLSLCCYILRIIYNNTKQD